MFAASQKAGARKAMFIGTKYFKHIALISLFALGVGACASDGAPGRQLVVEKSTRFDAEIARYTRLRQENPEDLQTLIHLSRVLRNAGRGEDAVTVLERAENNFGSHSDFLTELGNAHLVAGDAEAARLALNAAIERDQNNWRAFAALGVAHDLEQRYMEARNAYRNALNSCPNSAAILNNLALSESYSGQFASSMSHLTKAMQVQPGSLRIRRNWVVLSTLESRCADCERDEYARLARSIHPQDWRGPSNELSCTNQVPSTYQALRPSQIESAELIAAELDQNDFFDMRVWFEFDSAALTPEAHEALYQLGEAINSNTLLDYGFRLEGHADARGSEEYNQDLSIRRAAAVRDYLITSYGIEAHRLESIGFGESRLAAPAEPESGVNRRVRVVKLGQISDVPIAGL